MTTAEYLAASEKQLQLDRATLRADREALDAKRELLKTEAVALVAVERDLFKKEREELDVEKKKLGETKKQLEEDVKAWTELRQIATTMAGDTRIALNVGGTVFWTTRTTLTRTPVSFFSALLQWPSVPEGGFFIDRDSRYFGHILNIMRGLPVPRALAAKPEFQAEMKFYSLPVQAEPALVANSECAINIFNEIAKHNNHTSRYREVIVPDIIEVAVSSQHDTRIDLRRLIDITTSKSIRSQWEERGSQWLEVTFKCHAVCLTHYSFVCQRNDEQDQSLMRNWSLRASNDNLTWTVLNTHIRDESICETGQTGVSWPVVVTGEFYTHFQIITTGPSSGTSGDRWPLNVGHLSFFGHLRDATDGGSAEKRKREDDEDEDDDEEAL